MLKVLTKGFYPLLIHSILFFLQKTITLADLIAKGIRASRVVRELIVDTTTSLPHGIRLATSYTFIELVWTIHFHKRTFLKRELLEVPKDPE